MGGEISAIDWFNFNDSLGLYMLNAFSDFAHLRYFLVQFYLIGSSLRAEHTIFFMKFGGDDIHNKYRSSLHSFMKKIYISFIQPSSWTTLKNKIMKMNQVLLIEFLSLAYATIFVLNTYSLTTKINWISFCIYNIIIPLFIFLI